MHTEMLLYNILVVQMKISRVYKKILVKNEDNCY